MSTVASAVPGWPGVAIPLAQVITTEELARRPSRPPDLAAENSVLLGLAETMASAPHEVLQRLVDEARTLCRADSAGISLLEPPLPGSTDVHFRWKATSGGLGPFAGNTMPRDFSPCGTVLDYDRALLMSDPVRHFQYIERLPIPVREVLLVPFYRQGKAIGTVWVAAHSAERHFDREDERIVVSLSRFAAAAVQALENSEMKALGHQAARALAEGELARLAAAERERAEFLAALTHELRNMLAPMSNAVRIIEVSDDRTPRNRAREMLDRQIRLMNRLIADLLDTSRISAGKLTLDFADVDLTDIARNAAEASRSRIEESDQRFIIEIPDRKLQVRGDDMRLAQILGNLLLNAAKYGVAGGSVTLSVTQEGDHAVIRVRDTGIGIEPAMLSRVFDLFVQVDRSMKGSEGGLGIGLALVKRLTKLHGGYVEARSEGLGKGSEFAVYLPIAVT
jgi:signal transduction histidine kinase